METDNVVEVVLQPYAHLSFFLPKDWLRTALPSSIISRALKEDPNATSILIPDKNVSPDVLQLIVNLSQGREPLLHNPNLLLADRYLNIPELLYYADPYYDLIPNRSNGAAPENIEFIKKIIKENQVWPFGYLVLKGYTPTDMDLIEAVKDGAVDIVRLLLGDHRVNPAAYDNQAMISAARRGYDKVVALLLGDERVNPAANDNEAIRSSARRGYDKVVKLLLADERVNPAANDNEAIIWTAENGHDKVVGLLLADHRVNPDASDNQAIRSSARRGYDKVVELLLADYRVDPTARDNEAIKDAVKNGHLEVVRWLLTDPRVDPAAEGNWAIRWAAVNGRLEMVGLLLADPRVRNSLNPKDLAAYQQLIPTEIRQMMWPALE